MIYVGIDVASTKHDIFIINGSGEFFGKPFTITNNQVGMKKLLSQISVAKEFYHDYQVRIGLESTGHYSKNILHYLVKAGLDVIFINPILTNMDRKSVTVRKTKTDALDAKAICTFLSRNQNLQPYTLQSYHIDELKTLIRMIKSYKKQLNKMINQLHAHIHQAMPEYKGIFKDVDSKGSLMVLSHYASLSEFKRVRLNTLAELIRKSSRRNGLIKATKLKEMAINSIGIDSVATSICIKQLIHNINQTKQHITKLESSVQVHVDACDTQLLTIPGISYTTGAIILAELGDIKRFRNNDQVLAFAGLDPSVYQSGNYSRDLKISKRGSSILRWAIYQSANIIRMHDPIFIKYYQKKKDEGKRHQVILGHITKKLLRVIRSILVNNNPYLKQSH